MNLDSLHLDSSTLVFAPSILAFVLSSLSVAGYKFLGHNSFGHKDMGLALGSMGAAGLLFYLTEQLPFMATFLIANILSMQFAPYAITAFGKALSRKTPKNFGLYTTLIGLVGVIAHYVFAAPISLTVISIPLALGIQYLYLSILLGQVRLRSHSHLHTAFSGLLGLCALLMISRSITAILGDFHAVLPTSQTAQQMASVLMIAASGVMSFHCFVDIVNERVRSEATERLRRDGLTGLYTRTAFNEMQASIQARAAVENYAVLMVDIDHFKAINDNFGHSGGDVVLAHVGRFIAAYSRLSDIAIRYGGEEFCVLLWDCKKEAAELFSRRLIEEARSNRVRLNDGRSTHFTLSIGFACHLSSDRNENIDSVIERADLALYRAKNGGRNRACEATLHTEDATLLLI